MYLTYTDYVNMGGALDENTFNDLEFQARCVVDMYTYHRLDKETTYPEVLTRCIFALIKYIQAKWSMIPQFDSSGAITNDVGRYITSQSNDGVSISYSTLPGTSLVELCDSEIENIIRTYLYGVLDSLGHKLLYKGIYPDE